MRFTRSALTPGLFATVCLSVSLASAADPAVPAPATSVATPAPAPTAPLATPDPTSPAPESAVPAPTATTPPAAVAPAPASPPVAPAAPPPVVSQGITPAPAVFDPTRSIVHLASSYPQTALELKSSVDDTDWQRVCIAPCDRSVVVAGMLARASAPGMTTSNVFRIQPGAGPALIKVEGGSSSARSLGVIGLAAGIPVALGGAALFSYGKTDDRDGMAVGGAVMLGVGALAVLVALPFLVSGGTSVRNGEGRKIASAALAPRLY